MSETKLIPSNCDMPLSGRGDRRCRWAGIFKTEDGRMVCGHHAKMIGEELVEPDPDSDPGRPSTRTSA